jgi:hypothetical protein
MRRSTSGALVVWVGIFIDAVAFMSISQRFGQRGIYDPRTQPRIMTITNEVAALKAERDLLRAQLAKARHHKKPYEAMTTAEYRSALDRLGLSIVGSAEHLGLSRRQSQRYANGTSPIADPVAKLLRLAIRIGLSADDLKAI